MLSVLVRTRRSDVAAEALLGRAELREVVACLSQRDNVCSTGVLGVIELQRVVLPKKTGQMSYVPGGSFSRVRKPQQGQGRRDEVTAGG